MADAHRIRSLPVGAGYNGSEGGSRRKAADGDMVSSFTAHAAEPQADGSHDR